MLGNIFQRLRPGQIPKIVGGPFNPPAQVPKIVGGPFRPPVEVPGQAQPQAKAGLPLIIQQLYGGAQFTPGANTMEGSFGTSPGFRPGSPMNINMPSTFAPGYGSSINNPGPRTTIFIDSDGDGIDDRDQIGPGQPRVQTPSFSFGDVFGLGPMSQTTLADLSAFNPIANQYALAGFTVGEILAMPEFAEFAQFQAEQAEQAGVTATSTEQRPENRGDGIENLARFREMQARNALRNEIAENFDKFNMLPGYEETKLPGLLGFFDETLSNLDREIAIDRIMRDIDASKDFGVNKFGLETDYKGSSGIDRDPGDFETPTSGPAARDTDLGKSTGGKGPSTKSGKGQDTSGKGQSGGKMGGDNPGNTGGTSRF